MEIGYKSRWRTTCTHLCKKFGLLELVNLLWLRNISKEEMAILGMEYDSNVWNKIIVDRIKEYGRRWWINDFGINEIEQEYIHVNIQPNGSVGARGRLMARRGCLPVRGSNGIKWKYDDDLCMCGTKETELHVLFECKCYDQMRRWMRAWDGLDEKERSLNVIKGYVEANEDMERETLRYLGEVWTERQRNERNRVNVSEEK